METIWSKRRNKSIWFTNVLKWGTTVHDDKKTRRTRKSLPQDQEAEV